MKGARRPVKVLALIKIWRVWLQCVNRWVEMRLELLGQAVSLMVAVVVVLLRWPSDPGEP